MVAARDTLDSDNYLVEQEAPSFSNPTLPHLGGVQLELYFDLNPG